LTTDIEPFIQTRPSQSAGTLSSAHTGQPFADRPVFDHAPMSAPPSRPPPGVMYHFQDSGNQTPGGQSGPQGSQNFVRPIDPSQRFSQLPPGFNFIQASRPTQASQSQSHSQSYLTSHPPSASHPTQPREQNGQSHSRSRSFSDVRLVAPAPASHPNSGQFLTHPQALARYLHSTSSQSPPRPRSPSLGVTIPAGWQSNGSQQERVNVNGPSSEPHPQQSSFSSAGHPTIQRPIPVPFSIIDLTSPATMDREAAPKEGKKVPTHLLDPLTQRLCLLLYEVNSDRGLLMCRMCG
jgi:hypothetical protein